LWLPSSTLLLLVLFANRHVADDGMLTGLLLLPLAPL
jgi:hypothetical protein